MSCRATSPATLLGLLLLAGGGSMVDEGAAPLQIGETFTVESRSLGEARRINVFLPRAYEDSPSLRLPVLYMPDGGVGEDFLHIAGLVQVLAGNGAMRPFILVGIENTQRRRDLTGPTSIESDRKIAPRVGGSATFRRFIREELMPRVQERYRTTPESAIIGESLAGLFVVETFLLEPDLFDAYIAVDPSLWWDEGELVRSAGQRLRARPRAGKSLYLASSEEEAVEDACRRLAVAIARDAPALRLHHERMPEEKHSTIFHPAALKAARAVLGPAAGR